MEQYITGYTWYDNKEYAGTYSFPNNLDKEEIHLPPRTTLEAPPTFDSETQICIREENSWSVWDKNGH